ncbi:hypothetical protein Cch01nite_03180 [Cellulomonas chitinilytica]|uniref:DUF3592 domain-containing protein n=1 Tax=Cellulomonas chitinilytica TaxID=398759 RepID=A0A919P173_9CELL|nr:DUF3592 domain-containing protein [Cellulomonas chitinilytica]GIG19594.1 hypothetical protein Cch01nite_03180 [Cellulomonas chitinilytica]
MNSAQVSTVLLVLVAVGTTAGTWFAYGAAHALQERGVQASAVVVDVHQATARTDNSYVTVSFVDQAGQEQTVEVANYRWSPRPRVGDRPVVLYDPEDPSTIADVRMGPDFLLSWLLAAAAVTAGVLAWLTWTRRLDWSKLRWLTA